MVSNFPNKYIASSEGLRKALAKAKRFDRIARQTDAPPPSVQDVETVVVEDNEPDSSSEKH
jgi:hypothetical protein